MAHQISLPYSTSKVPHQKKGRKREEKKRRKKKEKKEKTFSHIFPEIIYMFRNSEHMLSSDFLRTMAMNIENRLDIHRGLGVQFLIPCFRQGYLPPVFIFSNSSSRCTGYDPQH
jgi:hypothetical protein